MYVLYKFNFMKGISIMNNVFRYCSVIILFAITSQLLTGCASETDSLAETTGSAEAESTSAQENTVDKNIEYEALPELDYDGATISMYVWGDPASPEYFVEEADGDIVNDAIYARNQAVEEQLNVKFEFTTRPGTNADRDTFVAGISNSIAAGDSAYEIVAGYSMCLASLTYSQMLVDLTSTDYLYFSNPWWSSGLMKNTSVYGKLYLSKSHLSSRSICTSVVIFTVFL